MSINELNLPAYDSAGLGAGSDTADLTGFVGTQDDTGATITSQTFVTDQMRTMTLSFYQYMDGGIVGQNMTWKFQVSADGSQWYDLYEVYGTTAPVKTVTGTAGSPSAFSYPLPCVTRYSRVVGTLSATVNAANYITVAMAKLALNPEAKIL